jgi:YVTN family beta-propeller protein
MKKIIVHTLFSIAVVALLTGFNSANCGPAQAPTGPVFQDGKVTCTYNSQTGKSTPTLVLVESGSNGQPDIYTEVGAEDFNPSAYSCPPGPTCGPGQTCGSGVVPCATPTPKNDTPVYPPLKLPGSKAAKRFQGAVSAASSAAAYLPPALLNLPFMPQAAISPPTTCSSSSPDVLQTSLDNNLVTRLSTCPFKIAATIPLSPSATEPMQIAITPDGQTALVTSLGGAVSFIDLNTNTLVYTLVDFSINPDGIAITPDGATAYVTSFSTTNSVVEVIDIASRKETGSILVNSLPQGAFITPDGSQVYITYPTGPSVYVIDTLTNTLATTIPVPTSFGVAFNSTGTRAYITSATVGTTPGSVKAVDTSSYQIVASYSAGVTPVDIEMLYGDRYLTVNDYTGSAFLVIDTVAGTTVTTPLAGTPVGLATVMH